MASLAGLAPAAAPDALLWFAKAQSAAIDAQSASASDVRVSRADLLTWCAGQPAEAVRGLRIGLAPMPTLEFLAALVWLDGLAESVILLPAEEDAAQRQARLAGGQVERVLEAGWLGPWPEQAASAAHSEALTWPHVGGVRVEARTVATRWLLPTSGTSGSPKLIGHDLAGLTRGLGKRGADGRTIWGCLYSVRRFAGLQVFLQAWCAGMPLVLRDDEESPSSTLARMLAAGANALSATPSMWRKLSMLPGFESLPLRQITLGGEIVDQAVLTLLAHCFPTARLTHIYASTEAGVGFSVHDGRAGFPRAYLEQPPGRLRLRISAAGHLCLAPLADGPALAGSPSGEAWLDSGDVVREEGDRILFLGRANGSINVGGNKVMPEEVEAVIKELPQLVFVHVRAKKSGILGNLVEACVLPAAGVPFDQDLKKAITTHCRERLEGFKVPAFISLTADVELTASGKLSRREAS